MFNRPLIAIDIGSSSIKLIELTGANRRQLRALGLEMLPHGAVSDGVIQDQEAVENALRRLLKKLKILAKGRRASISLGGSSIFVKKVDIAGDGSSPITDEQIIYEAEQHFQEDMDQIHFDWAEIGQKEGNVHTYMIVGARRELVEQYIQIVKAVGLRVAVIECDVFSTANMFEFNYGVVDGLSAIVNVGASVSQVSLISRGEYVYTRDIPIGGDEYSRQIMQAMDLDLANAESLKIAASQGDVSVPEQVGAVLGNLNEQLVSEIQMTIDYYFQGGDMHSDSHLSSVFLTGGGSRVLGLDAALAAALEVPVQILNPFQNIDVNPKKFEMDYIMMQGHLFGVAIGLGMRISEEIAA